MLDKFCRECGNPLITAPRTHISAKDHNGWKVIPVEDIRFFMAKDKYVWVYYSAGRFLIHNSLAQLEAEFGDDILRVNRNALIFQRYLEKVQVRKNSETVYNGTKHFTTYYWAIVDGHKVEVSRRHNGALKKACGN